MAQVTPDADIFATIWDLPESHVSVTKMDADGKPANDKAVVIVHEQGAAGKCLQHDNLSLIHI